MKYRVTRERAYWVKETQVVEADSEVDAEERFLDWFDPELEVKGVCRFGFSSELETPIEVTEEKESD